MITLRPKKHLVVYEYAQNYTIKQEQLWVSAPTTVQAETLAHLQKPEGSQIVGIWSPIKIQGHIRRSLCPFEEGSYIKVVDTYDNIQYFHIIKVGRVRVKVSRVHRVHRARKGGRIWEETKFHTDTRAILWGGSSWTYISKKQFNRKEEKVRRCKR